MKCKNCEKELTEQQVKNGNLFCSHSCSASFNNRGGCKNGTPYSNSGFCLNCGKPISKRYKYCNNTCSAKYKESQYIIRWKLGEETGLKGKDDVIASVKNYLFEKNNNSCQLCGWKQINPYTNKIPLQIHHIDGDCTNNKEENLQLLCPNCHSLTENFGSRNKNCTRIDKRIR